MRIEVVEYLEENGTSPYEKWFNGLDARAAAKITTAQNRMEAGNTSKLKPVGGGVSEYVLDFGPGYRVYVGQEGNTLIILLGGSSKKRQQKAIDLAKKRWKEYKIRKAKKQIGG
jgi:putative addiction module killer protein